MFFFFAQSPSDSTSPALLNSCCSSLCIEVRLAIGGEITDFEEESALATKNSWTSLRCISSGVRDH